MITITNYNPLGQRVIILPIKKETTDSGILISDNEEKFIEGEVVKIGNGIKESNFEIGNIVSYNRLKSEKIKIGDEIYNMTHHDDVVAIIN